MERRTGDPTHDVLGMQPTENEEVDNEASLIEKVTVLVREHLRPSMLYNDREKVTRCDSRLALRFDSKLLLVAEADHLQDYRGCIRREFQSNVLDQRLNLCS